MSPCPCAVLASETKLQTVGTVRITVAQANAGRPPRLGALQLQGGDGLHGEGDSVPGTTLRFIGKTDEEAQFEGPVTTPIAASTSSLAWQPDGPHLPRHDAARRSHEDIVTLAGLASITVQ